MGARAELFLFAHEQIDSDFLCERLYSLVPV